MTFARQLFIGREEPREEPRDVDPAFSRWVDRLRREALADKPDEEGTPASGNENPADGGDQGCKEEADGHSARAPGTAGSGAEEHPTSEQNDGHGNRSCEHEEEQGRHHHHVWQYP